MSEEPQPLKRRQISVRGTTHAKLKDFCEAKGVTIGSQIDQWVAQKFGHTSESHTKPIRRSKLTSKREPAKSKKETEKVEKPRRDDAWHMERRRRRRAGRVRKAEVPTDEIAQVPPPLQREKPSTERPLSRGRPAPKPEEDKPLSEEVPAYLVLK